MAGRLPGRAGGKWQEELIGQQVYDMGQSNAHRSEDGCLVSRVSSNLCKYRACLALASKSRTAATPIEAHLSTRVPGWLSLAAHTPRLLVGYLQRVQSALQPRVPTDSLGSTTGTHKNARKLHQGT